MQFDLSDEERMIQETAAKFALRELRPKAAELDRTKDRAILLANLKKLAELGFMGLNIRAEYGGTETTTDAEGRPVRDEESTTYTGAIETAVEFSGRIYTEAYQRGWSRAEKKVVMGDGAEWIWNIRQEQFPGAIEIVDQFHARQHLWELGAKLHPSDEPAKRRWVMAHQHLLDEGQIELLVAKLRALPSDDPKLAESIRREANYFESNAARMRYPEFRRQGLFVGTGVIEAGCKTLIGGRLKRSGMFWTVRGANAVIALRCCRQSREFNDYWEARRS